MAHMGGIGESSKKTKWLALLLIAGLLGVILGLLYIALHGRSSYADQYNGYPIIEGALDHDTGEYLSQQNYFVEDFARIIEVDFPGHGENAEADSSGRDANPKTPQVNSIEWMDCLRLMKDRQNYLEKRKVAEPFLDYKQEVDAYFADTVSRLEEMVETDSYDAGRLSAMYAELVGFAAEKAGELPGLLDELGVDYTIEEDESGNQRIRYGYTDRMLLPQ